MSSKIIEDLTHIPNIIAGLGLSIAQAQKAFDLDYIQSLERIVVMAQSLLGGRKSGEGGTQSAELDAAERERLLQFQGVFKELLVALAPSRYQFTETTLSVKLDLAQHLDVSAGGGVSAGISGVAVNAALSIGYGSDYRGAAECRTVLQAIPSDPATLRLLLDRARELPSQELTLPARSKADSEILSQSSRIYQRMVGTAPAQITESADSKDSAKGTT